MQKNLTINEERWCRKRYTRGKVGPNQLENGLFLNPWTTVS